MEPRPQTSRPAQDQSPPRRTPSPAAGSGAGDTGSFQQQPDPTTIVAPPRADYDYSPLDLAPPGQRRRRQMVAAVLGGLVMLMLTSAVVFAFLLVRDDDDPEGNGNNVAVAQTEVAQGESAPVDATLAAAQTIIAERGGANAPENAESGGVATDVPAEPDGAASQPTTAEVAGQEAAPTPTSPPAADAAVLTGVLSEQQLAALLPDANIMPPGLTEMAESSRTQADVVAALGSSREAETNLETWGWSGNPERVFTAPEAEPVAPEATSFISVSVHGFSSEQAAAEALPFYSDILLTLGYQETQMDQIGASSRLMVLPQEGGGTEVALYVQQGSVLYRFGGFSQAGDPTQDVLNVARQVVAQ